MRETEAGSVRGSLSAFISACVISRGCFSATATVSFFLSQNSSSECSTDEQIQKIRCTTHCGSLVEKLLGHDSYLLITVESFFMDESTSSHMKHDSPDQ